MCHERQYLFLFLAFFCIRRPALLSVSFTSDSNFSFKIVWPLSIKHFLKSEILPQTFRGVPS